MRILSLPIALLMAFNGWAKPVFRASRNVYHSPVSACATSNTTLPHDTLLEGWQNNGAENTWTPWIGTDVASFNLNFDSSALTANKPAGACDRALQVDVGNIAGLESLSYDTGSLIDLDTVAVDAYFYIYVTTPPDEGEAFAFFLLNNTAAGSSSVCMQMNVRTSGGVLQVQGEGGTSTGYNNLPANQWNKIKIHMDVTPANSYFNINDGSNFGFTRVLADFQWVHIGGLEGHIANENVTYVIDLVTLDTP